ncbi:acyltransferase [Chitinophaga pendula]|nr:acyltransferase [Chitinophaga pendula]
MFGCNPSPGFWNTYLHIEVRNPESRIVIGSNVTINNACSIISEGATISISDNCLIGINCQIVDTDFHTINPFQRSSGLHEKADVIIGRNVWIGNNAIILKGVTIGENSVIAAGSVVNKNIPSNSVAGGVPARVLKHIEINE